jgi:hypothetical protein
MATRPVSPVLSTQLCKAALLSAVPRQFGDLRSPIAPKHHILSRLMSRCRVCTPASMLARSSALMSLQDRIAAFLVALRRR